MSDHAAYANLASFNCYLNSGYAGIDNLFGQAVEIPIDPKVPDMRLEQDQVRESAYSLSSTIGSTKSPVVVPLPAISG